MIWKKLNRNKKMPCLNVCSSCLQVIFKTALSPVKSSPHDTKGPGTKKKMATIPPQQMRFARRYDVHLRARASFWGKISRAQCKQFKADQYNSSNTNNLSWINWEKIDSSQFDTAFKTLNGEEFRKRWKRIWYIISKYIHWHVLYCWMFFITGIKYFLKNLFKC